MDGQINTDARAQDGGAPRVVAITCMRNEGPFVLEWIAYHRLIGVTDFLVYSNDCTDGTDRLLDALAARGLLTHLPNPARGRRYQMEALKDAARQPLVQAADWIWIADVDEFLNIHVGRHTIADLIEAAAQPDAMSIHYQYFANAGVDGFSDSPVIEQFARCHNPDIWCGELAIEVKTLVRKGFPRRYFGAHRPFLKASALKGAPPVWTDGSGRPVPQAFLEAANTRRIRRFPARGARDFASLNHYALRSLDSYLVKIDRGDVNRATRAFDEIYWRERNDAALIDRSIQRHLPALQQALDSLRSDPEIATLHAETVERHLSRRDEMLKRPDIRDLRDRLRTAPPLPPAEEALLQRLGLAA